MSNRLLILILMLCVTAVVISVINLVKLNTQGEQIDTLLKAQPTTVPQPTTMPQKPESRSVSVDRTFNGEKIEVAKGDLVVVKLESNPSTGYRWEFAKKLDENILRLAKSEFKSWGAKPGIVGVGGIKVWTFEAVGTGAENIIMVHIRPGEKETIGEKFSLKVVVR